MYKPCFDNMSWSCAFGHAFVHTIQKVIVLKAYPCQCHVHVCGFTTLQIIFATTNGYLRFAYLFLSAWKLEEKLRKSHTALPLNWWLLTLVQGFTWSFVGLTISIRAKKLPRTLVRLFSILAIPQAQTISH